MFWLMVNNRSVVVGSREREANTQSNRTGDMCRETKESNELLYFSKIQPVVYHQCCVLIG